LIQYKNDLDSLEAVSVVGSGSSSCYESQANQEKEEDTLMFAKSRKYEDKIQILMVEIQMLKNKLNL
jgi:hypothetical protein